MSLNRREFMQMMAIGSLLPQSILASQQIANFPSFGQIRLLHITDCHAQLLPIYYREPQTNLGIGTLQGKVPHIVAEQFLRHFNIQTNTPQAHAFTSLNYIEAAEKYGKVGGFAYLATLIRQLRENYGYEKTLLLDSGDTWQGSGVAYWTKGQDMVGATNLLGVDMMTGHWEFTYEAQQILNNIKKFKGEFLAQNIFVKEEALFNDAPAYDEDSGLAFKPYTMRELNGVQVAVIGQAFPYTPVANPARFIPDWTYGIYEQKLQKIVNYIKQREKPAVIVLLSHNGMDVDLKIAQRVTGINAILGGHTHDAVPIPVQIKNTAGTTLVCNAGSNGKFVGVLDFAVKMAKVTDFQYNLLPVFSNLLQADQEMQTYISETRKPYLSQLNEKLAVTEQLLYRRDNFQGTFDQIICDALRSHYDAEIAFSPGFRWGTTILPGQTITMEDVLNHTAITYPESYVKNLTGQQIKQTLEDVSDNLFNANPYKQQGGDMVRVGGMSYVCDPTQVMSKRISQMTLDNGKAIKMHQQYKVAGWATRHISPGKPIWEIVANYLRQQKVIKLTKLNNVKLVNVENNVGLIN